MNHANHARQMLFAAVLGSVLFMLGCSNTPPDQQNNEKLRQQSAAATRDLKQGAKELAADSKVAAANAVNGVNAVAEGVKEGAHSDTGAAGANADLVDINNASTARLALLPGISISKADDIVKGRPYDDAHSLVRRGLLTQAQFDRIAGKITAR